MAVSDASVDQNGGYDIDYREMLGHGGFGYVYKATNRAGVTVAVKFIDLQSHPNLAYEEAIKCLKIRNEHTHIIDIYDVFKVDGNIRIFMEFCKHGNLRDYFENSSHPLTTTHKIKLMAQTADALSHLHQREIIHRDVKPENILVQSYDGEEEPVAKLGDFGISKILEAGMHSTMSSDVGTSAFKAPEFWQRDKNGRLQYKRVVDVFAAGLTFLAMIQTNQGDRIAPGIEEKQSLDATEQEQAIGYTMYVRLKNSQPVPNIISIDGDEMVQRVKLLIRKMIEVLPAKRLPAEDVKNELYAIIESYPD